MQIVNGAVLFSPSDLTHAAECEFAVLRGLDLKLGRVESLDIPEDPLMKRAAGLGDAHERRVLAEYRRQFGAGVVEVQRPGSSDPAALAVAMRETLDAMDAGADVVFQAVVFDGDFHGFADFLVRTPEGEYEGRDAKLARHAKVPALLQIAAYADVLRCNGAPMARNGALILGDLRQESFDLDPVIPVYRDRRRTLTDMVQAHVASGSTASWDVPGIVICGRCSLCEQEAAARDDLLLVAGMRMTQRAKLHDAGVMTVAQLAERGQAVPQMSARTLNTLREQARLQSDGPGDGSLSYDVYNPSALAAIPPPSPGDIFFDFEGDPMWQEPGSTKWGLEYLFGYVEPSPGQPTFTAFWAHDRQQERQALTDFVEYVRVRRQQWPDMHVYHYAAYEKTALLRLAAMHGVGEEQVDDLLRDNVLVDLYPIVKGSLRVSAPSYGLKKLEPLYMGDELREGDVTTAGDSVIQYASYCDAVAEGDDAQARHLLDEIADYNRYDCVSTLRLRDWLLGRAADRGIAAQGAVVPDQDAAQKQDEQDTPIRQALAAFAEPAPKTPRTDEQTAAALMAAAIGFHRRENKPYWWGHYDRLSQPVDEWADSRDTMIVDEMEVVQDWHVVPPKRNHRRTMRLEGQLQAGSSLERAKDCNVLYEAPHPPKMKDAGEGTRGWGGAQILSYAVLDDGRCSFTCPRPWSTVSSTLIRTRETSWSTPRVTYGSSTTARWASSILSRWRACNCWLAGS